VLVALLALAACGGGDEAKERVEASPLRATLEQSRAAQVRHVVNVVLTNPTDREVRIGALRLVDERFEPVEPTERAVEVRPNVPELLVPVAIGRARCRESEVPPSIELDRGRRVPVDDEGAALLDRLVEDACDLEAVADVASIFFDGTQARVVSEVAVDVTLRLERRGAGGTVTVDAVGSNVIFTATSRDLPAALGPGDEAMDVTVTLSAERCEPHALAESKKTFQLPVWVALDDGEPQFLELTVTGEPRRALDVALHEGCAAP